MKLLFDQNLSPKLPIYVKDLFNESAHLQDLGLDKSNDLLVWEYAKTNSFTIITKDSDFNNIISLFGFPPKVIWLRRGNSSTTTIIEMIESHIETINSFIKDDENGILSIF